ncbi:hypothetical protein LINGRAPRIM_LOCUS3244 [Linum grandiflorum]
MNMLVFPRVDMLQKSVLIQQSDGDNMAPAEGPKLNNYDDGCPAGFDLNITYEPTQQVDGNASCKYGAVESSLLSDVCLNNTTDLICEIPGNVQENGANIHNLISVGDANEQSVEVF